MIELINISNSHFIFISALVEKTDVNWSSLVGGSLKGKETTSENMATNPFDEVGLSRRWAGEELYTEMSNLKIKAEIKNKMLINENNSGIKVKKETDNIKVNEDNNNIEVDKDINNIEVDKYNNNDAINDHGFLDDVALYHVDAWRRKSKLQGVGALVGALDQALYARKDLLVRRVLCGLDKVGFLFSFCRLFMDISRL